MKISGIYKIQSKCKPERIYIGSSMDVKERQKTHLYRLKKNNHINPKLQYHYNKYGEDDLIFEVIIGCDKDNLIAMEQFYIDALDPWFNVCPVAGNTAGRFVSDETRAKLSKVHKGKPTWVKGKRLTEQHKRRISESMKGKNNPMYGKPSPKKGKKSEYPNKFKGKKGRYSEETLIKMRASNKLAWEKRKQKKEELWPL